MKNTDSIKKEAKRIQQLLKDKKYIFEVEHVRPMEGFVANTPDGPDDMLSRGEFNKAAKENKFTFSLPLTDEESNGGYIELFYGRFVKAIGGFTKVTIIKDDGSQIVEKYNHHDNFCKSLGFIRAVSKALGKEIREKK